MKNIRFAIAACVGAGLFYGPASVAEFQKNYVSIVGSSDIAPYAKAVSERFGKGKRYQPPLLQPSGTGGGFKLFCEGLGPEAPDVTLAVRPMKAKEKAECAKNGVGEIVEVEIGYDGVILAQSKNAEPLALTRKDLRQAFAAWLADKDGKLVQNTHRTWKDVNPALPAQPIMIHGPANTTGVYDAFTDLAVGAECKSHPWVQNGKAEATPDMLHKCRMLRDPGVYVNDPIDNASSVSQLAQSSSEMGLVHWKMLQDNGAKLRAIPIDGIEPTYDNIASGTYPGTQRLYVYAKGEHLATTPGLKDFIAEFASENALSEKGYLKPMGLVTLSPEQRAASRAELQSYGINPSTAVTAAPAKAAGKVSAKKEKKK